MHLHSISSIYVIKHQTIDCMALFAVTGCVRFLSRVAWGSLSEPLTCDGSGSYRPHHSLSLVSDLAYATNMHEIICNYDATKISILNKHFEGSCVLLRLNSILMFDADKLLQTVCKLCANFVQLCAKTDKQKKILLFALLE